jgi:hypothetical protein
MHTPSAVNAISEQFEVGVPGSIPTSALAVLRQPALPSRMSNGGWEQSRLYSTEVLTVSCFEFRTGAAWHAFRLLLGSRAASAGW